MPPTKRAKKTDETAGATRKRGKTDETAGASKKRGKKTDETAGASKSAEMADETQTATTSAELTVTFPRFGTLTGVRRTTMGRTSLSCVGHSHLMVATSDGTGRCRQASRTL